MIKMEPLLFFGKLAKSKPTFTIPNSPQAKRIAAEIESRFPAVRDSVTLLQNAHKTALKNELRKPFDILNPPNLFDRFTAISSGEVVDKVKFSYNPFTRKINDIKTIIIVPR